MAKQNKTSSANAKNRRPAANKRHVTSYDVASLAGVSQSAVSRCFKPGASVSKQMRERVLRAVEELGYQPNAIARGLITRRSNMVGVIVSNLNVYPEVLSELSARFTDHGVHVLLFTLNHESDVGRTLDQLWQYQVDGVVAAAHLTPVQIELFRARRVPLVFYNRAYDYAPACSVCCDQVAGERILVERLVQSGEHQSFAIISGPGDSVVSMQRTRGALAQLQHAGIENILTLEGDYSYESGRHATQEIIATRGSAPDAIICGNDMIALGCLDQLRYQHDLDVPGDVSVVGFDGMRAAGWASYDLTTIQQPVESMAEAAVSLLMSRLYNEDQPPEKRVFSGVLRAGSTVRG